MDTIKIEMLVTLNCKRSKSKKLQTLELIKEAIEERLEEMSGSYDVCETLMDDHRVGHILIQALGETLEICGV